MKNALVLLVAGFLFATTGKVRAEIEFTFPQNALTTQPAAVFVAGSFNDWNTAATPMALAGTTWTARLQLPDGRHFYKFVWRDRRGQTNWMNDPTNPFMADNGSHGANNFMDVRGGVRVVVPDGLEAFEWPPSPTRWAVAHAGERSWLTPVTVGMYPPQPRKASEKWVGVAGDFNDWRLGQFSLVRCRDDVWRAFIPIRRPFSYKIIAEGRWYYDRGNDPLPAIELSGPGGAPRPIPPKAISHVPDGYGRFNAYREQPVVTSPALAVIDRPVFPGNPRDLDEISSCAKSCDYGRAVALARKVREVNAEASGATATLVLQALALEAQIHRRWARLDEAVPCWQAIMASDRDTTMTRQAAQELAAYHLYVTNDYRAARTVCEWAMKRMRASPEAVAIFTKYAASTLGEHRYVETLATVETTLGFLPPPDGKNKDYACAITEVWLVKGYCHFHLKQWDKAREAFHKVIEIHPWSDSQNVQKAQKWLGFVERRKIDPYDPL